MKPWRGHFIREQVELGFGSFNLVKVGQEVFTKGNRGIFDFDSGLSGVTRCLCVDQVHDHVFSLAHGAPGARVHVFQVGARQPLGEGARLGGESELVPYYI